MNSSKSTPKAGAAAPSPSTQIDARIAELGDWRGEMLARVRGLIKKAVPDIVETWKWRGVPVWERDGIICTGETYKAVVKLTFAKGAALDDPSKLFNSSLDGNVRRAIDIREGDKIDEKAFVALVRAAMALNTSKQTAARAPRASKAQKKPVEHIEYHKDGSVWARGQKLDGVLTGYWEWFRKDGVRMRSGYFTNGEQTGEWTTYDKSGAVHKVTTMKPKKQKA